MTSNRSDEFSFLFSYQYISPHSTIVSVQWISRYISFSVFDVCWNCHHPNNLDNVFKCNPTMLNNCNWQWLGFVCKVVLNEIPDNTHLIGIFTKHCTSSMAQIDYRCLATSNHITKTLDKNLTAISALSHLTLWAIKYLDKQQVQWIYNQQKQIQTANTFP